MTLKGDVVDKQLTTLIAPVHLTSLFRLVINEVHVIDEELTALVTLIVDFAFCLFVTPQ